MNRNAFPSVRMRRLRKSEKLRRLVSLPEPAPQNFIWPVFVVEGKKKEIPIESMPGQFRRSIDRLLKALEPVADSGIGGLMLFGVAEELSKSDDAAYASDPDGLVQKTIREVRRNFPELAVFSDLCLCAYTKHGHCGILDANGIPDNDRTNEVLARIALSHAEAGADAVAPSAMMDGQVVSIRTALDKNNFHDTLIMSYSAKFASSSYAPFRDAAQSAPSCGDRKSHQLPSGDLAQALRESLLDEGEGADILMVKPALLYLDVISRLRERTLLPLAAFNVSGEYSMIHASAKCGWGNLHEMARESLFSIRRAGAGIIISYWANQYRRIFLDCKT